MEGRRRRRQPKSVVTSEAKTIAVAEQSDRVWVSQKEVEDELRPLEVITVEHVRNLMNKWKDKSGKYPYFGVAGRNLERTLKIRDQQAEEEQKEKKKSEKSLLETFLDERRVIDAELTERDKAKIQTLLANRWEMIRLTNSQRYFKKPDPTKPSYYQDSFALDLGRLLARANGKKISDEQIPFAEVMPTLKNADADCIIDTDVKISESQPHDLIISEDCTTLMHVDDLLAYRESSNSPTLMNCYRQGNIVPLSINENRQFYLRNPKKYEQYLKATEKSNTAGWITETMVQKLKLLAEQLAIAEESDTNVSEFTKEDDATSTGGPAEKARQFYTYFRGLSATERQGINAIPIPGIELLDLPIKNRTPNFEDLLNSVVNGYKNDKGKFEQTCEQAAARLIASVISPYLYGKPSGKQFNNDRLNENSKEREWVVGTKIAARTINDIVMPASLPSYCKPLADAVDAMHKQQAELKPNKLAAYHEALQKLNEIVNPLLDADKKLKDAKADDLSQLFTVLVDIKNQLRKMKMDTPALNRFDGMFQGVRRLWAGNESRTYKIAAKVYQQTVLQILRHYREHLPTPRIATITRPKAATVAPIRGFNIAQFSQMPVEQLLSTWINTLPTPKKKVGVAEEKSTASTESGSLELSERSERSRSSLSSRSG